MKSTYHDGLQSHINCFDFREYASRLGKIKATLLPFLQLLLCLCGEGQLLKQKLGTELHSGRKQRGLYYSFLRDYNLSDKQRTNLKCIFRHFVISRLLSFFKFISLNIPNITQFLKDKQKTSGFSLAFDEMPS